MRKKSGESLLEVANIVGGWLIKMNCKQREGGDEKEKLAIRARKLGGWRGSDGWSVGLVVWLVDRG